MNNNFTPLPEKILHEDTSHKTTRSNNKFSVLVLLMVMTIIPLSYVGVQTYKLTKTQAATVPTLTPTVIPTLMPIEPTVSKVIEASPTAAFVIPTAIPTTQN